MKLGVHSVLYADQMQTDPEKVIYKLSQTGASGFEISENYLINENKIKQELEKYNMKISGIHCMNLHLMDLVNDVEKAKMAIQATAEKAVLFDCTNVIISGVIPIKEIMNIPINQGSSVLELHDPTFVANMAKELNEIVLRIKQDYGIEVHYHNHSWEYADNALIWNSLIEYAPELKFALDIGWATSLGYDSLQLIKSCPDRFSYIHLRDCKEYNIGDESFDYVRKSFVELGHGKIATTSFIKELQKILPSNAWIVIEYEVGKFNTETYKKSIDYVKKGYCQ